MPTGAIRRAIAVSIAPAFAGLAAMSREARSAMPSVPRNSACDTGPSQASPRPVMACGEGCEVDLRRQVGLAGRGKRVVVAMGADRLQRIAERRRDVSVVDEECGEWLPERGELLRPIREGGSARLEHGAVVKATRASCGGSSTLASVAPSTNASRPAASRPTHRGCQRPARNDPLREGERVEELIGDHDDGPMVPARHRGRCTTQSAARSPQRAARCSAASAALVSTR